MSVDLSKLSASKSVGKAKKVFPVFPADDELKQMADEVARLAEQETAAKAGKETLQAEIKSRTREFIFRLNHGKEVAQTTISLQGSETELLIALKDAYSVIDDLDDIKMIIGEERAHRLFHHAFKIEIKSEMIPEDCQQGIIDGIATLLDEYGCKDALSAKAVYKPAKTFAIERHTLLTVDENMALETGAKAITTMSVAASRGRK